MCSTARTCLVALLLVRLRPAGEPQGVRGAVWRELKDGIVYVLRHPTIRLLLMLIATSAVLGRGPLEMLPAFADAVFERGSAGLAILTSAVGAGAIVAGLVLARGTDWLGLEVVAGSLFLGGQLLVALGLSANFWLSMAIVAALGAMLSLCGVGSQILLQTVIDDEVRGRVSSFWGMVAFGGIALGGLLIGTLSSLYGLREVTIASGIACAAVTLLTLLRHWRNERRRKDAA